MAKKGNTRRARKLRQRPRKTRKQRGGQPLLQRLVQQTPKFSISGVRPMATATSQSIYFKPHSKIPKSVFNSFQTKEYQKLLDIYGKQYTPGTRKPELARMAEEELEKLGLLVKNTSNSLTIVPSSPVTRHVDELDIEEELNNVVPITSPLSKTAEELVTLNVAVPIRPIPHESQYSIVERLTEVKHIYTIYFTPVGKLQRKLATLTPKNARQFKLTNTRVSNLRGAYTQENAAKFKADMIEILDLTLQNASKTDIKRILNTFTPKRIDDLRLAIFRVYLSNSVIANNIVNILFSDIIPRNKFSPDMIDGIITILKGDPGTIEDELQKVSTQITGTSLKHEQETILAELKGRGWFKAQTYYRLIQYGIGGLVIFLLAYNRITSIDSLKWTLEMMKDSSTPSFQEYIASRFHDYGADVLVEQVKDFLASKQKYFTEEAELGKSATEAVSAKKQEYFNFVESRRPKPFYKQVTNYFSSAAAPEQMK